MLNLFLFVGCYFWIISYSVESYEYGYHPSSEEFDGLLREKSWTRDILLNERNTKKFTPKFNLGKPRDIPLSSTPPVMDSPFSVGSSVASDKYSHQLYTQDGLISHSSESVVAEVNEIQNHNTTLPIFFTNPATGIVYAITEVGVNTNKTDLSSSGSIPIFVSKEQYERDLYLLKKSYESKCSGKRQPSQVVKINRKPSSNFHNTRLFVKRNSTRIAKEKKRKHHRKSKKANKELKKLQDTRSSLEKLANLDTQLEKPNGLNLVPSVFSESTDSSKLNKFKPESAFSRSKNEFLSEDSHQHKLTKRSLNATEKPTSTLSHIDTYEISTRSINSSDSSEKSKKILSTQIQVTSEYIEPPAKIRTPKNSIEETSHTETPLPQLPSLTSLKHLKPPCKNTESKVKKKKKRPVSEEYDDDEDDFSFGGTSYNDGSSDESDDDESSNQVEYSESSLENNLPDYNSLEEASTMNQQDDNYRHKKTSRKRIKRRRPYDGNDDGEYADEDYDADNDDDDDYDNESDDGVFGMIRGLFTPVQWVMDALFDRAEQMFQKPSLSESNDNRKPKFPQYTVYNGGSTNDAAANNNNEETYDGDEEGNSIGSWFSSWFKLRKRRGTSTTPAPSTDGMEEEPSWFESWFGYDTKIPPASEEDSEPWFFGWFSAKPRPKRTTTTTTTTTSVPILTISEPLKNPHKWIGILAQHIINSTSTNSPLIETTTENPDIPKKISYNKYQIWRLKPKTESQVRTLEEIKKDEEGARLQWLKGPSLRGLTDVVIPPKMLIDFQGTLDFENIDHEILIFDVGKVISYEKAKQDDITILKKPNSGKPIMSWNRYYDYDSIIKYLEVLQVRNSQYVELIHIGRSYEGRPLVIAKVGLKNFNDKTEKKKKLKLSKKPEQANSVFIEAGVHGREWIAPASATWMINELLKVMKSNKTNPGTEYIKNTTWYIMPVANPDGYEYSLEYNRLWKKSRSRHISKPSGIIDSAMTWLQKKKSEKVCFGVDLNHNWHFNWGRKGSSKTPCNEFFAGPTSFSEPETRAISKFLLENRKQIKLFISLQAYGQMISYPNKLNASFQLDKLDDLLDVAMFATDALRKKGSNSRYKVDASNDFGENKSGSSDYFAAFEVGIPFSYTIHLADNGIHGFLLPSTFIEPTAKDAYDMITAMIDYI
ncbi:uncharacterized protein LOC129909538 [Episyrphus balteatus]|uniref:uncharacterized protein LOC129909538 n=1 Tax=Episyrphus balteatus TaxID=286459 RepID=UPI00248577C6|nr:uncharacterized protein LOC129909538 [Episyrphus balteatus]